MIWDRTNLRGIPRRGWVRGATPIHVLDDLARGLGFGWFGVKRDDRIDELYGGTKVRKLDYLLAAEPWRDAKAWASLGAIGSGQLVASTAAALCLDRELHAHLFWEPASEYVRNNLAYTASHAERLEFSADRIRAALWCPTLVRGGVVEGAVVIPPGATHRVALLGIVRAGLELAEQVRAGELPEPDAVYLPLGSCGTAAGLAVGLALGGLDTTVCAIAVERPFATKKRTERLVGEVVSELSRTHRIPHGFRPVPIEVDTGFIGAGYGHPTLAGLAAIELMKSRGVALEAVYSAKAMAALVERAPRFRGRDVLFWLTPRGSTPPSRANWMSRLPNDLRRRLNPQQHLLTRRHLLAGAAAAAVVFAGIRTTGYAPHQAGEVLGVRELHVVAAAARALLPLGPGPSPLEVARNVDRYLVGMPAPIVRDIHLLLALVEQGTGLGCTPVRFTRLDIEARLAFLDRIRKLPEPIGSAYRGLRDLVLLGHYQDPATWPALGYEGPTTRTRGLHGRPAPTPSRYDDLIAQAGWLPTGVVS